MCVISLHLAFSVSCFTRLLPSPYDSLSLSTFPSTRSCRTYLSQKRRACASPHEDEKFGYLAKSALNTGYEPKWVRQDHFCGQWHDAHQRFEPQFLRLLDNTHENIGLFSVLTVFESSISHVSHNDFVLQKESREIMQSGNRCWTERKEREGFVICAAESMSKKGWWNGISLSLKSHREFCSEESQKILFWWTRSPRSMKSSTSYCWWKFRSEKMILDWVQHGDPEFEAKNFTTRIVRVTTRAWISKTTIIGSQSKRAQRERIHLCGRLGMKVHLHQECYASSCREMEELKSCCSQGRKSLKTRLIEFPTQHDQESRTVGLFFYDPDLPSSYDCTYVPHQALITSSSRMPSREVGMLRNTRENMSILGNVFDCQHARRDPDELQNDSRNLATSLAILRKEGMKNSGSEEPLQSILQ